MTNVKITDAVAERIQSIADEYDLDSAEVISIMLDCFMDNNGVAEYIQ